MLDFIYDVYNLPVEPVILYDDFNDSPWMGENPPLAAYLQLSAISLHDLD